MSREVEAPLNSPEQLDLAIRSKAGDREARNRLVDLNYGLITDAASQCRVRYASHMDLADLKQIAWMGFFRAIDTYDPSAGKLGSYVFLVMRREIKAELQKTSRMVRRPAHTWHFRARLKAVDPSLQKLTAEQAAEILGRPLSMAKDLLRPEIRQHPDRDLHEKMWFFPTEVSRIDDAEEISRLFALADLAPKEHETLLSVFGLGRPQLDPAQIARDQGVSGQCIRERLRKGLAKLQKHAVISF